eukprot:TRINITY_DN173_c0_g1_i1.p1 TRINITY_DN173_c0_g1~~TRINITY_DN173_c0_g1_i1.p1  ORF type:complete len:257 (+),score=64.92 TRINITY_DN173_c0_g1_i1:154-924(+)
MNAFGSYAENWFSARPVNFEAVKNFSTLSPSVQKHLQKVYLTLAASLLVVALGVWVDVTVVNLGGFLSTIAFAASVFWLNSTPPTTGNQGQRMKLLMAAAFFQGCSLGPLIGTVLGMEGGAGIIGTACFCSSFVFCCFSGAALLAKRREYLFLGGILSSLLSAMAILRLSSFFFGMSATVFRAEIYLGLLMLVGYVVYDTQVIVEKASRGERDPVKHSLDLLIDFVGIFVRILIILLRNSSRREDEKRKRSRSNRS